MGINKFSNLAILNKEFFLGLKDKPKTFAPKKFIIMINHEPLNPVCPVINTFLFFQNFYFFFINVM